MSYVGAFFVRINESFKAKNLDGNVDVRHS